MRPALALLLIAFSAICLGACGGDDDSSTSTGASGSGIEGTANGAASGEDETASDGSSDNGSAQSDSTGDAASGDGGPASREVGPGNDSDIPDRGEVSTKSAPFQQYSAKGKLHLAEFGKEASSGNLAETEAVVEAYLEAFAAAEWSTACDYLLAETRTQLVELTGAQQSQGCGEALALFAKSPLARTGTDGTPIYAPEGIASLRIKEGGLAGGGAGFALFHASDGQDRWMALKVEEGKWKLLSYTPQPFQ